MKRKATFFWMCLMLTGLVLFPGLSTVIHAGEEPVLIRGKVFFDGPVAGATVSILDKDRNVLATQTNATDESGRFEVPVPPQPPDHKLIIIVLPGGDVVKTQYAKTQDPLSSEREIMSVTETPFEEELARFVNHFDPEMEYPVNILSTILWDFWKLGGTDDYEKAEEYLCDYLQLPGYLNMTDVIEWSSNGYDAYFNADYFREDMEEMWDYTNYEEFMEFVVRNIQWFAEDMAAAETMAQYGGDPDVLAESRKWRYTIRNLPKDLSESPLTTPRAGVAPGTVLDAAGFVFNVIGFGLNAIYKNLPESAEKRIMGTALAYMFEGGPDPVFTALFENLKDINRKLDQIQGQIRGLHTYAEKQSPTTPIGRGMRKPPRRGLKAIFAA
ncbi:MAG: hypothetical protein GY846_13630 [Deltaproteobacteria bacterium]|nr:hypothetical protein [Deltaproteobacteria bacterium]